MWEHHCVACVPSVFAVRTGVDVDSSPVFPQGVLAAVTLMGGGWYCRS